MQSKIIPKRKIFPRKYLLNFVPGSTQICVETWVNSLKTPKTFFDFMPRFILVSAIYTVLIVPCSTTLHGKYTRM